MRNTCKALPLLLTALLLLSACCIRGRSTVLQPFTGQENETRRLVATEAASEPPDGNEVMEFVVHATSHKFHVSTDCRHVKGMSEQNRLIMRASAVSLVQQGFSPCKTCAAVYTHLLPNESGADQ